ncbi:MAG TPA: hypothetical protein VD966_11895 [Pyrinomonadaceae bacterium]|nr:hypothetical protein [Pyrinomonadaceae bacterium]
MLGLTISPVWAQQRGRPRPPAAKNEEATDARREQAIALLNETADAARSFDDLFYGARIQTLAADALWPFDQQRARVIFRRAWEAATASDRAEQEEASRESGERVDASGASFTESRDEVLAKAAARDAQLAEAFLRDLLDEKSHENGATRNERPARRTPWRELSAGGVRRLALARELLERGEYARAHEIAAPLINEGVSGDLIALILQLRVHKPAEADTLYLRLLERTLADAQADANDVLLLSSVLISPGLLVVVDEHGALQFRPSVHRSASVGPRWANVPQAVRNAFFNVAARVLLSSFGPSAGAGATQKLIASYFAIGRLLPLFEREAAQYASELRVRLGALANEIESSRRDLLSSKLDLYSLTSGRAGDPLRPQVEQLARARSAAERDQLSLAIVKTAARNRLWDRARRAAASVEDLEARRAALSFIAVSQIADISRAYADDKEDDYESVVRFVSGADVPPLASAWGFAQAALIAARKKERQRVRELLNEAERHAARVDHGTPQRIAAYAVVTGAAARLERRRAWELLSQLVRATNAVEDYAGGEISLEIAARENSTEGASDHFSVTAEAFRLDVVFAKMARLDFAKALAEARSLEGDVPKAIASLAIARTVLEANKAME